MSDQSAFPPPDEPAAALEPPSTSARRPKGSPGRTTAVPWLYGLGFLILAGAVFYLWQYPSAPSETVSTASELQTAEQRLEAVDGRLTRLEQGPKPPSAADLARLSTRLDSLEARQPATPTDLAKLSARLDALESRVSDQVQLASRLDVVSGRIESLSGRGQTGLDDVKQQLDKVAARAGSLEKAAGNLQSVTSRANRTARLQSAALALAVGRPLGDVPDAPPALSRYAHAAPPTLAGLRLAFPQVEQAVSGANPANGGGGPFLDRVWERAQGLVTVRQGGAVVVGDASAIALTRAKTALDAGDLAAAAGAISSLGPDAPQAAADWLADAKALLAARSALADMGARS